MQNIELHAHSYYSTLDGLNSPEEYLARAKELGMSHMALTDHGTLSGHRHFQKAAKEAGIVPILGMEAYISPTDRFDKRTKAARSEGDAVYNHIILLARDQGGLETLQRVNEKAYAEGFYSKPRIDLDLLEEDNDGLIVLSGCLNSLICKAISRDDMDKAFEYAAVLKEILGDRFYMELQTHNGEDMNNKLLLIADTLGIPPVATSDCHYAKKEDLWIEEALLILSTSPKLNKEFDFARSQKMDILERFNYLYPDRKMTFQEIEIYLKSIEEHKNEFKAQGIDRDDLYANTNEIANQIGTYEFYQNLDLLPKPEEDPGIVFSRMIKEGLKRTGHDKDPVAVARAWEEYDIIMDKNFAPYFIVVADIVQWAKSQGIRVGPGRGSAAGSEICYLLNITTVPPLEYNLLFMRFINPERNDWPDVDIDFEDKRRGEVQDYVRRRYPYTGSIATVGVFAEKEPIKAAARAFKVNLGETTKVTKKIETFDDYQRSTDPLIVEYKNKYPEVEKLAKELIGRVKSRGKHAAGMIVSNAPISKYAPIETGLDTKTKERVPMLAYDMRDAADIGFIKIDLLGLKDLTVIEDSLKMIKERTGKDLDLEKISLDDRKVYEMLSAGYTKGIPQCGGAPYTQLILKIGGVWSFDELSASNALVRPGAMDSIGAEYIARKSGKADVQYYHPCMEEFTKDTYGEILYQEQVMLTMTELAGMKMATADKVRKLIGKKEDVSKFLPYKEEFVEGASQKVSKVVAEKLWHDFEAHANYSFNKSHAVAYSTLSYWCTWLKTHYPLEFMTALLANEDDKDAITEYLIEAKRMGIKILLPHVNKSAVNFGIEGDAIRFGISNIKYFSEITATRLLQYAPFKDYEALQSFMGAKGSGLGSRQLTSLNKVGAAAFDDNLLTGEERDNFYEYLRVPAFSNTLTPSMKAQLTPLEEYVEGDAVVVMGMVKKIKNGDSWSLVELLDETGSIGVFTGPETPIEEGKQYAMILAGKNIIKYLPASEVTTESSHAIAEYLNTPYYQELTDDFVKIVGFRTRTTKAGKKMADMVFSDADKSLAHALVFPGNFPKVYSACKEGTSVAVKFGRTKEGQLFVDNV